MQTTGDPSARRWCLAPGTPRLDRDRFQPLMGSSSRTWASAAIRLRAQALLRRSKQSDRSHEQFDAVIRCSTRTAVIEITPATVGATEEDGVFHLAFDTGWVLRASLSLLLFATVLVFLAAENVTLAGPHRWFVRSGIAASIFGKLVPQV